jgi:cob(I)alamin adenosyltransferase
MATKEQFEELKSSNNTIIETLANMNATLQTVVGLKASVDKLQAEVGEVKTQIQQQKDEMSAGLSAVNRRVDEVQATISSQSSRPTESKPPKASIKDVLPRAVMRLEQLYDEASHLEGTVIVGKLPSAPADKYNEKLIPDVVAQLSGSQTSISPRGDK